LELGIVWEKSYGKARMLQADFSGHSDEVSEDQSADRNAGSKGHSHVVSDWG
jgi:hypothetical protein